MKIAILAEGSTAEQRLAKHWGLSVLIDGDILFDTFGQPEYVLEQLRRANIDTARIKHIVISHDDWDHITGLWQIRKHARDAVIYICPHFAPAIKARIALCGARVIEVDTPLEIRDAVYLSGELKGGSRDGVALPEQYLAMRTSEGVVVITGCAHPGIIEIVRHVKKNIGPDVRLLMGGFHMKDGTDEANEHIIAALKELGVRRVMPLHCTGKRGVEIFRRAYGDDCVISGEGQVIDL